MSEIKHPAFIKQQNGKCISEVVIIPEGIGFRIYVAWEWENPAKEGRFKIYKSQHTVASLKIVDSELLEDVMNHGLYVDENSSIHSYLNLRNGKSK